MLISFLLEKQQKDSRKDIAIVRVEQLHPFPKTQVVTELSKYKKPEIIWVQEEPENMGAWAYMSLNLKSVDLKGIFRPASAACAEGSKKLHEKRLKHLFDNLFAFAKTI
jgi:2-oxoglutarate dehydrogenase E1 component